MLTQAATNFDRADFGLIGWLEATRVSLPLKGVEARFEVAGEVAHVELDQVYHQTAGRPLDCLYTFPLPAGAAVHRCELHVNGRVISARVEELQRARTIYHEARQSGRRASLMESVRPNLFTLNLANVQPNDLVVVRLAYVQILERLGSERRLRIPFCPGIRYVPGRSLKRPNSGTGLLDDTDQVPDASRISPPRIDAFHPDAAYLAIFGVLKTPAEGVRLTNHSHALQTAVEPTQLRIVLETNGAVPDQDFLLGWEPATVLNLQPSAWTSSRAGWNYCLIELRAPSAPGRVNREPLDVYFLLDRSGSMEGSKWTQACDALSRILKQLSEGDRVQVTWYETSFADLASGPTPVESFRRDWPTGRLEQLGTAGGTELLPALEHVLGQVDNHSAARKPVVVLVTDGQVANEAAVTMALRNHPRLVVHTFGIDTTVNDALLTQMAQQQRGRCVLLRPDEDIAAAIGRLGHLLASPVVTDLQTPAGWETADGPLPDLYAGETATAVLRGAGALPRELTGRDPRGQPITLNLAPRLLASPAISLLWAKRRITFLEARRDFVPAITLAKEFNLICQGAAFVAWDEVEKVPVANDQIVQPSMEIAKDTVFSPGYFGMIGDQDDETLTAGSLSGRGFFEPPSRDRSTRPSLVNLLRQPDPTPTWAQEPMFDCAWGPEVVLLLTQWLASHAGLRLRLAEWRLRKLIAGVVGKAGANPEDQLREFVHRLDTLVGTVGPHHEALELIRQNAGWQSVETPEP